MYMCIMTIGLLCSYFKFNTVEFRSNQLSNKLKSYYMYVKHIIHTVPLSLHVLWLDHTFVLVEVFPLDGCYVCVRTLTGDYIEQFCYSATITDCTGHYNLINGWYSKREEKVSKEKQDIIDILRLD